MKRNNVISIIQGVIAIAILWFLVSTINYPVTFSLLANLDLQVYISCWIMLFLK